MKIYVINWMYGCVRMYLFPEYIENKSNKFFYWCLDYDGDVVSDIENWIREHKNGLKKVTYQDLPDEIREDFEFKRLKEKKFDFFEEVDVYEFQTNSKII